MRRDLAARELEPVVPEELVVLGAKLVVRRDLAAPELEPEVPVDLIVLGAELSVRRDLTSLDTARQSSPTSSCVSLGPVAKRVATAWAPTPKPHQQRGSHAAAQAPNTMTWWHTIAHTTAWPATAR